MTHPRQTIRNNAKTLLTGLNTTGSNVFDSQVYPLESGNLPALVIEMGEEEPADSDDQSIDFDEEIEAELRINVLAAKSSNVDDQIDTILDEIQQAIKTDRKLSGVLSRSALYGGLEEPEYSDEGEMEHAMMTVIYIVTYEVSL